MRSPSDWMIARSTVFRSWRVDVEDEQIERDAEATRRELDELDEEWDRAVGEAKQKVKAEIDATRAKLKALRDAKEKAKQELAKAQEEVKGLAQDLDDEVLYDIYQVTGKKFLK